LNDHSFEIGTNSLFDDRAQEMIVHDPLVRSQLPKQEPDRVYGLRVTSNFEKLLSQSMANDSVPGISTTIGEAVSVSPFKGVTDPLLFPFLILEAKSENSRDGFYSIQTQTAFPIMALLKLQENLQSKIPNGELGTDPLVWFFGHRGEDWRVYGCYVNKDIQPPQYVSLVFLGWLRPAN
jgi:hypothetical protein